MSKREERSRKLRPTRSFGNIEQIVSPRRGSVGVSSNGIEIKIDKDDTKSHEKVRRFSCQADATSNSIQNLMRIKRDSSKLIDEHLREIQNRITGHTMAYQRYSNIDRIIGFPVAVLGSFVASSFMVIIFDNADNSAVKIVGLIMSITSFLCSVVRDYLGFSKISAEHNISAKLYTSLLRSIELRLVNSGVDTVERRDIFKDIIDQMGIIEQYETDIPPDIEEKVKQNPTIPRSIKLNEVDLN